MITSKISLYINPIKLPLRPAFNKPKMQGLRLSPLTTDVFQRSSISFQGTNNPSEINIPEDKSSIYKDSEKFSKYFDERLKKELLIKDEKDVDNIINNVQKKTGADEQTVREVVSRLSQFSSYKEMFPIGDAMKSYPHGAIFKDLREYTGKWGVTLLEALNYAGYQKEQMCREGEETRRRNTFSSNVFFMDDFVISMLNKTKNEDPEEFERFLKSMSLEPMQLAVIDGLNVKLDGKYYSYGMFGKNVELDEFATKVIQKMKKEGITLDEALNGDIIKDVKNIFGEDVEIDIVKNGSAKNLETSAITERIRPTLPPKGLLEGLIEVFVEEEIRSQNPEDKETAKQVLRKYFDSMFVAQSADSFNDEMKLLYNKIEAIVKSKGKTMDDVVYLIPAEGKSYELMNYQYAKVNDIPPEKFFQCRFEYEGKPNLENKTIVILDDVICSGHSVNGQCFTYSYFANFARNKNVDIIFAATTASSVGKEYIEKKIAKEQRADKDFVISNHSFDFKGFLDGLSDEERELFEASVGYFGYNKTGSAIAMPYMAPDNNSVIGLAYAQSFLNNPSVVRQTTHLLGVTYEKYLNRLNPET